MRYLIFKLLLITMFLSHSPSVFANGDNYIKQNNNNNKNNIKPAKINISEWKKKSDKITFLDREQSISEIPEIETRKSYPLWVIKLSNALLYLFILAVVLLMIYLLIQTFNEEEWATRKQSIGTKKTFKEYQVESLTHETPINELKNALENSIKNNDVRATIRIQYLIIIRQLINIRLISWRKNKTNLDYIHELKSGKLRNDFIGLTRDYERVWYGKQILSEELKNSNNSRYQELANAIKSSPINE